MVIYHVISYCNAKLLAGFLYFGTFSFVKRNRPVTVARTDTNINSASHLFWRHRDSGLEGSLLLRRR